MTTSNTVDGAVLGPSRLPPARPNVCEVGDCHSGVRRQVVSLATNEVIWTCVQCAEELRARYPFLRMVWP